MLGFREFRVRHHGDIARLEVSPGEFASLVEQRGQVNHAVRAAGFQRVLLDLNGYRRGALNEGLAAGQLVQIGSAA